jgi:predicted RNA binding protein YcfA (HicA-like mRNA interferase family)
MELDITLSQCSDRKVVAEIPRLPGVLVLGDDAATSLSRIQALALQVLAEKIKLGELDLAPPVIKFILDPGSIILLDQDRLNIEANLSLPTDVLETIATEFFDPLANIAGSIGGGISESLIGGRQHRFRPRASDILADLLTDGWQVYQNTPSHRVLHNPEGKELFFCFQDEDILRNELLHQFRMIIETI